jgi:acetoin utilization deacetylase AcuC-like enzyme
MHWFYSPDYDYGRHLPISQLHGFLLNKPSAIRRLLIERHGLSPDTFLSPTTSPSDAITSADIARVHTPAVEQGLRSSAYIARVIEVPLLRWLPAPFLASQLVTPQRVACAGTLAALRAAFHGDWAFNLSGGFHHARPNLSHGFCLLNDIAIALARLRSQQETQETQENLTRRVLILDLDLHQGDGNSAAFAGDPNTFTASIHQESAFPHPKIPSDLDVGLPDGTTEAQYLAHLDAVLAAILTRFSPEVIVYVAGVDPFQGDPMSALGLSAAGLVARDVRVARFARAQQAALVVLPAGGYCAQSPLIHADGFAAIAAEHPTIKPRLTA